MTGSRRRGRVLRGAACSTSRVAVATTRIVAWRATPGKRRRAFTQVTGSDQMSKQLARGATGDIAGCACNCRRRGSLRFRRRRDRAPRRSDDARLRAAARLLDGSRRCRSGSAFRAACHRLRSGTLRLGLKRAGLPPPPLWPVSQGVLPRFFGPISYCKAPKPRARSGPIIACAATPRTLSIRAGCRQAAGR